MAAATPANQPELILLDAANPASPVQDCTIIPASGGRFITATSIAFWLGDSLRTADIGLSRVVTTATLPAVPTEGAFSRDGSRFAYRVGDDTDGLSDHLFVAGHDITLVSRPGIGGHGGPPYGPLSQLEFSADGKYLLSVDSFGANFASGPPNFDVYDEKGTTVFQSASAAFGTWATRSDKLYFLHESVTHGVSGDLHSWDPLGGEVPVAHGLSSYFWPRTSPDYQGLLFDSYDTSGLPHLWSVDVSSGKATQISTGMSSVPVFVGTSFVWSNEEQLCNCGPVGASAPDGKLVARELQTGHEVSFSLASSAPPEEANTRFIDDVWFA
jgi:hypothetical protein